jgi:hypothetical protein
VSGIGKASSAVGQLGTITEARLNSYFPYRFMVDKRVAGVDFACASFFCQPVIQK